MLVGQLRQPGREAHQLNLEVGAGVAHRLAVLDYRQADLIVAGLGVGGQGETGRHGAFGPGRGRKLKSPGPGGINLFAFLEFEKLLQKLLALRRLDFAAEDQALLQGSIAPGGRLAAPP